MRWLLGLIAFILLALGAAFGVGYFLLPNALEVTRTVEIERPRATVFALVSDLRIVQEWSPYRALDPEAEYLFSGPEGEVGQSMRWRSTKSRVGDGSMTILEMRENEYVGGTLELVDKARLASAFTVAETGGDATRVEWRVNGSCAEGWIMVPCRYMNLVISSAIARDMDVGLAELQRLAEELPTEDFEGLQVEITSEPPRPYIYQNIQIATATAQAQAAEVAAATRAADAAVVAIAAAQGITLASRDRIVVVSQNDGEFYRFRVGYAYTGPRPLGALTGVETGETPSGRMARVVYEGMRGGLARVYPQIDAYLQAHRIALRDGGLPWEVYVADDLTADVEPTTVRVEIYLPIE
jgi:hypothetical protein